MKKQYKCFHTEGTLTYILERMSRDPDLQKPSTQVLEMVRIPGAGSVNPVEGWQKVYVIYTVEEQQMTAAEAGIFA